MYYLRFQFLAKFICCTLLLFVSSSSFAKQQVAPPHPEREAAIKLLEAGKNAEAVQAFRHYLSNTQNSKDAEVWLYFGIAQYRNKEIEAAVGTLKNAVKLNANSNFAHSTYATVLYDAHKLKDAEKEVNESLKLNANNAEALYLRGVLRHNKGDYAKALADAEMVLQLTPNFAPTYILKAQAMIGLQYTKSRSRQHEFPPEWKDVFLQAAKNVERYLQLNPSTKDADSWREWMNALRLYSGDENSSGCERATATLHPEITHREKARYTDEARMYGIKGRILIRAIFDIDGQVKHLIPLTYLGGGLTLEAIRATQKIRFKPALKDGKPVCVSLAVEFSFELL